ncbi:hypothetical protein DL1_03915 [Thioclava dalianensis]|uniref:Type VI secretion protein n=1 Tax=Thioclava dalianensis TaxID=1185766 RepID=A0A074TH23_9RHOB|nr:type VI secretion system-associated protein TagO [Thioclava dalianensis]KEP69445.1 hypothetical protein DL1_03915 [Thioclava dalianensis]
MNFKLIFAAIIAACAGPALAQENCKAIKDDPARLACYDLANGVSETTKLSGAGLGKWQKAVDTSKLTDEKNVFLHLESEDPLPGRFGAAGTAELWLRCQENKTSAFFTFNDNFMSDIQGYGTIDYRIDDHPMQKLRTSASTDNKALGLWSGGTAIPFIKSLTNSQELVVRATPFNASALTMTFNTSGLDSALKELREPCHW